MADAWDLYQHIQASEEKRAIDGQGRPFLSQQLLTSAAQQLAFLVSRERVANHGVELMQQALEQRGIIPRELLKPEAWERHVRGLISREKNTGPEQTREQERAVPTRDRVKKVVDKMLEDFNRPRQSPWNERVAHNGADIKPEKKPEQQRDRGHGIGR